MSRDPRALARRVAERGRQRRAALRPVVAELRAERSGERARLTELREQQADRARVGTLADQRIPGFFPTPRALSFLAASQVAAGQADAARASVAKIRHIARDYSADQLMMTNYYRRNTDKIELRKRLNQAGLN